MWVLKLTHQQNICEEESVINNLITVTNSRYSTATIPRNNANSVKENVLQYAKRQWLAQSPAEARLLCVYSEVSNEIMICG
jgi:hypothetical protein